MPVLIQPSSSSNPAVRAIPGDLVAREDVQTSTNKAIPDAGAARAGVAASAGSTDAQVVNGPAVDSIPAGGLTITMIWTVEPTSSTTTSPDVQSTVTVTQVVPPSSTTSVSSTESISSTETTSAAQTTSSDQELSTSTTSTTTTSSTSTTTLATSTSSTETLATETTVSVTTTSSEVSPTVISSSTSNVEPQVMSTVIVQDNSGQKVTSTITIQSHGQAAPTSPAINAANSPPPLKPITAAAQNGKVNPAVIVVPIILVLLLFIGLGVFFMRRHFLTKRQRRRNTWGAGIYPPQAPPPEDFGSTGRNYEQPRMSNFSPSTMNGGAPMGMSAPMVQVMPPPQAPMSGSMYSSPMMPVATPAQAYNSPSLLAPSMSPYSTTGGGFGAGALVPAGTQSQATVKCSFVPSLPDELSIAAGEPIRLLAEYDDGWALCENVRGEQGMVPLDCLDRGNGPSTPTSVTSFTARSQRRASSLAGAGIRG